MNVRLVGLTEVVMIEESSRLLSPYRLLVITGFDNWMYRIKAHLGRRPSLVGEMDKVEGVPLSDSKHSVFGQEVIEDRWDVKV